MTLKSRFLQPQLKFLEISRFRLVVGIILGILYAFVFYSFLYVSREAFRVLSVNEHHDMLVLSDTEVSFYNLFFAYIAVILGQSMCFGFWFDKPTRFKEQYNRRKLSIVNDQRVLNWFFLDWFAKVAVAFAIMFVVNLRGGQFVFSFYPEYRYIFAGIIIVLFMQTWITLRWTYLRKSWKWLVLSIAIVSTFSLGLSKINLIDYHAINHHFLQKNIQYHYTLDLSKSDFYDRLGSRTLLENIYVVTGKNCHLHAEPIIVMDNQELTINGLGKKIEALQLLYEEHSRKMITYQLHIHREIEMGFINQLKRELERNGVFRIAYAVVPSNHEFDQRYYTDYVVWQPLFRTITDQNLSADHLKSLDAETTMIEIKQLVLDGCLVNDSLVGNERLEEVLVNLIPNNKDYLIKLYLNEQAKFSSYLDLITSYQKAINQKRDIISISQFSKKYDDLTTMEEKKTIYKKYPNRLFELISGVDERALPQY
jgi:hypothetical protein